MKKLLLIAFSLALLTACAEKDQFEQAVVAQIDKEKKLQKEQHLKDYEIDPEYLAKCVVDVSSSNMPGVIAFDPVRMAAYRNYTKMLNLSSSADPKKTLEELRKDFGSPKALADANANYTESMLECYTAIVSQTESDVK